MTHSFGAPAGHRPYTNIHPPGPVWVFVRLILYSSPFWTAGLWLTRYLLPDRDLNTSTTAIFLTLTAVSYAFFRMLRQRMYQLKANRSPNWIAWHLFALLLITALPVWYCFQSLQPLCRSLDIPSDIAAIPAIAIAWQLTRHYRLLR